MKPRKGSLAICGLGTLGLITEDEPQEVTYSDNNKGFAYVGIHLTDKISKIGNNWSSRNPKVIGYVDNILYGYNIAKEENSDVVSFVSKKIKYKNYIGEYYYSVYENQYFGKIINVSDLISFGGENNDEVEESFKNAVDDYIFLCNDLNKNNYE